MAKTTNLKVLETPTPLLLLANPMKLAIKKISLAILLLSLTTMVACFGNNPLGEEFNISNMGFGVSSVSEGGSSISFGASQSSNLAPDAELGLTAYGLQFLSIRRMVIVPIHVSGEDKEGIEMSLWNWGFTI